MTVRTHKLEIAYNECLKATAALHDLESRRRLRLKIALLEQENDDLREQGWDHEAEIENLYASKEELSGEVAAANKAMEAIRAELRCKSRQTETLSVLSSAEQGRMTLTDI